MVAALRRKEVPEPRPPRPPRTRPGSRDFDVVACRRLPAPPPPAPPWPKASTPAKRPASRTTSLRDSPFRFEYAPSLLVKILLRGPRPARRRATSALTPGPPPKHS